MNDKELLTSATRIVYSVIDLSKDIKIQWSELIHYFFLNKLPVSQIRDCEIMGASRPFTSDGALNFFLTLPNEHQRWTAAALKLLLTRISETSNHSAKKNLSALIDQCSSKAGLANDQAGYLELRKGFEEFKKRKRFLIKGNIRLFTIDYSIRWLILLVHNQLGFRSQSDNSEIFITVGNWVVSLLIFGLALYQRKKDQAFNEGLAQNHNFSFLFGFKYTYSTAHYTILGIYLFTGPIISYFIFDDAGTALASMIALVFYYYFLLQIFPIGRLTEQQLENQLYEKDASDFSDADDNDERIVLLETKLNSNSGRLEAYVLESALFGALAFSAFLQIFATNLISFADVEKFATSVHHLLHGLVMANGDEFSQNLTSLSNKESLFSLISIETLVCSGLFVAVIASRLRFSHVADQMRTDLNVAKAYNEKEERLLDGPELSARNHERFEKVNKRVHDHLTQAAKKLMDIEPIVKYIVYFRNLGVVVFAAVLITSCLFISTVLAVAFLAVVGTTWVYFNYRSINVWISTLALQLQIYFVQHKFILPLISFSSLLVGVAVQVQFGWGMSAYMLSLSFLSAGAFLAITFLMPHYDSRFGDVGTTMWDTTKTVYTFSIFLSGLGLAMKTLSMTGSGELIMTGFCLMMVLNYMVAYQLTRPKWTAYFWGSVLSASTCGILFNIQNLIGGQEMLRVGLWGILLWAIVFAARPHLFHRLFVGITLVAAIGVIAWTSNFFGYNFRTSLISRLRTMYQHQTANISPILNLRDEIFKPLDKRGDISDLEIQKSIEASEHYIKNYGTHFGITQIYRGIILNYEDVVTDLAFGAKRPDSVSLAKAYSLIHQANKIAAMFRYEIRPGIGTEAIILHDMGKKEQIPEYYNSILKVAASESLREEIKKNLEQLKEMK